MSTTAENVLSEIIDHFADGKANPGDWWAPSECRTSMGLDWRDNEGRKFWLDLDKDGTITVMWKRPNGELSVVVFDELTSR